MLRNVRRYRDGDVLMRNSENELRGKITLYLPPIRNARMAHFYVLDFFLDHFSTIRKRFKCFFLALLTGLELKFCCFGLI